jgi:hypothetical protein
MGIQTGHITWPKIGWAFAFLVLLTSNDLLKKVQIASSKLLRPFAWREPVHIQS